MKRQTLIAASVAAVAGSILYGPSLPVPKGRTPTAIEISGCRGYLINGQEPTSCILTNLVFNSPRRGAAVLDWPKHPQVKVVHSQASDVPATALPYFRLSVSTTAPTVWEQR